MEVRTLTFPRDKRSEVKRGTDGFLRVSVFLFFEDKCVCVLLDSFLGALGLFFFVSSLPSSLFQTEEKHPAISTPTHVYTFDFYRYLFVYSGFLFIGRCGLIWLKPSDGVERCIYT